MGRGSNKKGSQMDDVMKSEVEPLDHMHNAEPRSDNARVMEDVAAPEATSDERVEEENKPS